MNVTFACPACEAANRCEFSDQTQELRCAGCGQAITVPPQAYRDGRVEHCFVCPSEDLFVRKDFPQRLGVLLVAIGIIGSSIAWYYSSPVWTFIILGGSALLDMLLYSLVGNCLMCYRCRAEYRGLSGLTEYEPFNLETHEKHRQQLIRLAEAKARAPQAASESS